MRARQPRRVLHRRRPASADRALRRRPRHRPRDPQRRLDRVGGVHAVGGARPHGATVRVRRQRSRAESRGRGDRHRGRRVAARGRLRSRRRPGRQSSATLALPPNVVLHGRVSDAEKQWLFAQAALALNPMKVGFWLEPEARRLPRRRPPGAELDGRRARFQPRARRLPRTGRSRARGARRRDRHQPAARLVRDHRQRHARSCKANTTGA